MNRGNGGGFRGRSRGGFEHRGRGLGFRGRGYEPRRGPGRGFSDRGRRGYDWRGPRPWRGGGDFPRGRGLPFRPSLGSDNERHIFRKGNGNPRWQNRPPTMHERLNERDVGITEFISPHEGFGGIIKQRFSDFHVNEIDEEGEVVTLTDMEPPETIVIKRDDCPKLEDILPQSFCEQLREIGGAEGKKGSVEIDVTHISKEDRKKMHEAIRGEFGDKLNSNTKTTDDVKMLVICRSGSGGRQDGRQPWPEDRAGKFLHFVLFKENLDTMEAVSFIASRFNMNPSSVNYAGTKDKRGVTCQKVSMFKVEPSRLLEKCTRQARIKLGNFEFKAKPLQLGHLRGNRFRIALRNVNGSDEQIGQAAASLRDNGFINYYGLQRFGNSLEIPTHQIGKQLLLGNWKEAVNLILKPRPNEQNIELGKARQVWSETGFANKAWNILGRKDYSIEGKLLSGLVKRGETNYVDALETLPRNTRLLYLHSYQSLVWNKVVSRRIREFGLKPIVGDLVLLEDNVQSEVFFDVAPFEDEAEKKPEGEVEKQEEEEVPKEAESKSGEANKEASDAEAKKEDGKEVETDEVQLSGDQISVETLAKRPLVKVLAEEDLDRYSVTDIVLPLPGFDISLPENSVRDWYEEYLSADGLSIAGMKQKIKKYSLGGAYRKVIIRPAHFSWRTLRYKEPDDTLLISDLEALNGVEAPVDQEDGAYKALILDFHLPSSAYATMALRDVLKQDTSQSFQASLSQSAEKKRKEAEAKEGTEAKRPRVEGGAEPAEESQPQELSVDEPAEDSPQEMSVDEPAEESQPQEMSVDKPAVPTDQATAVDVDSSHQELPLAN